MAGRCFVSSMLLILFLAGATDAIMNVLSDLPVEEEALIQLFHTENPRRIRRDLGRGTVPSFFGVSFTLKDVAVTMTLTRSPQNVSIPMYEQNDDGLWIKVDLPHEQYSAVYQDRSKHASFLVQWEPFDANFKLTGSFLFNNHVWNIEPNTMDETLHLVQRMQSGKPNEADITEARLKEEMRALPFPPNKVDVYSNHRFRRGVEPIPEDMYIIKCSFWIDYSIFKVFLKRYNDDVFEAKLMLLKFFTIIAADVDSRMQSTEEVAEDFKLNFLAVHIFIAKKSKHASWSEMSKSKQNKKEADADKMLKYFCDFQKKVHEYDEPVGLLHSWDWAIGFTKYILVSKKKNVPAKGFSKKFCYDGASKNQKCSVVNLYAATSYGHITAHVMGKALGAKIDDNDSGECSKDQLYIMSKKLTKIAPESKADHRFKFSSCSVWAMYKYLDMENPEEGPSKCLLKYTGVYPSVYHKQNEHKTGGQYFSLDQQCSIGGYSGSMACTNAEYPDTMSEDICKFGVACTDSEGNCVGHVMVLDGTPCGGMDMICMGAECVSDMMTTESSQAEFFL